MRGYHKEKGNPICTLKIDFMNAYDSVNCEFIALVFLKDF